ncbi:MAG TPA: hypothetical protein VMW08_10245 [Acidimicrobiales bacterium]|nr:hypothetical protein [Acidimicrobiales bacterium]
MKPARLDPAESSPLYRGVMVAVVVGIVVGLGVLALATRLGSALGG